MEQGVWIKREHKTKRERMEEVVMAKLGRKQNNKKVSPSPPGPGPGGGGNGSLSSSCMSLPVGGGKREDVQCLLHVFGEDG